MADYASLVRNLLKSVAQPQTDSFAVDVQWQHITEDGRGGRTPGAATIVRALWDSKRKIVATSGGDRAVVIATLTFVSPLTGVSGNDIFTLPDGTTAPIVETGGFIDAATNEPFVTDVQLGTVVNGD